MNTKNKTNFNCKKKRSKLLIPMGKSIKLGKYIVLDFSIYITDFLYNFNIFFIYHKNNTLHSYKLKVNVIFC
jgi:hypothetical protein